MLQKKLPGDPEYKFSRIVSAAISDALHRMSRALRAFDEREGFMSDVFVRKAAIPAHIKTRATGREQIADIRQATTPYAILKELDAAPPKEENE